MKKEIIERITFECPYDDAAKWLEHFQKQGFFFTRAGGKQIDIMQYSRDTFKGIAERTIRKTYTRLK